MTITPCPLGPQVILISRHVCIDVNIRGSLSKMRAAVAGQEMRVVDPEMRVS